MIFHENRLLDDSQEISYLILFQKLGKISQNLSSAAVLIGALRVNAKKGKCILCVNSNSSRASEWGLIQNEN